MFGSGFVDKILKSWPEDISGVHFTVNSERNEVKIVIYWFNGMNTFLRFEEIAGK